MKKVKIINLTAHRLDFAYAEPDTLTERKVDFSIEPTGPALGADFVGTTWEFPEGVYVHQQTPELDDASREYLERLIKKISRHTQTLYLIYVSRIALEAVKASEIPVIGENYIIGCIVAASQRNVKPPVAAANHISA